MIVSTVIEDYFCRSETFNLSSLSQEGCALPLLDVLSKYTQPVLISTVLSSHKITSYHSSHSCVYFHSFIQPFIPIWNQHSLFLNPIHFLHMSLNYPVGFFTHTLRFCLKTTYNVFIDLLHFLNISLDYRISTIRYCNCPIGSVCFHIPFIHPVLIFIQ